ncbi:hypothetical protein [Nitratiruptor sp. YY09-18]|uniref:hypothetical protein n=1 Tax=Nitratiruptor sp. YY09-18 TaxID=2724901 RepID=UPI001916A86D|nr:hypothetical protein [Nitratiruptor sp. YY09-18]BCD68489.1 DNA topoisomerase III [Nitratiruptor sp. YY09-18]
MQSKVGKCPKCGKAVVDRGSFYGCAGFVKGCDFSIGKSSLSHLGHPTITPKEMRALLKDSAQLSFRMSSGVERLYWVELVQKDGKYLAQVDFEAGVAAKSLGSCPVCGVDVVEYPLSFGCSRWEEGCEFAIFKDAIKRFGGKALTKKQAKELLQKGQIEVKIRGFDKKMKKVNLLLDSEFGCRVDFKNR